MKWTRLISGFLGLVMMILPGVEVMAARGDMNPPERQARTRQAPRAERQPVPRPGNPPAMQRNRDSERQNPAPERRKPAPERRNPDPERRKPDPGHRNIDPDHRNIDPDHRNIDPGHRNIDPDNHGRHLPDYPPNWRPPGPPPHDWHPHYPPPPNWHPYPPPPGFPAGYYPRSFYPGYVAPVLVEPYQGYTVGEAIAGALVVGMVIHAISAASEPVVVHDTTYYYDGDNYYEEVNDGLDTVYRVADNPYDH